MPHRHPQAGRPAVRRRRSSSRSSTASPSSTTPVGVTVPGIVRRGVVLSAANIDKSWIGEDADAIFTEALGREVHVVNDADAAGLAEAEYGAAKGRDGLVMVITLGTGIGSAMICDGELVPNSEMGHLELDGAVAESRAATSAREREGRQLGGVVGAADRPTSATSSGSSPPTSSSSAAGSSKSWEKFGHLHRDRDRDHPRQAGEPRRHRRRRPRRPPQGRPGRLSRARPGVRSARRPARTPRSRRGGSARRPPAPPR